MKIYEEATFRITESKKSRMEYIGDVMQENHPSCDIISIEQKVGYWEVKTQFLVNEFPEM